MLRRSPWRATVLPSEFACVHSSAYHHPNLFANRRDEDRHVTAAESDFPQHISANLCVEDRKRTRWTAWVIGISTRYFLASATTALVVGTPSTTPAISSRTSSSLRPLPSNSPAERLRPVGLKQVVARSPTPAMPKKVSCRAPM